MPARSADRTWRGVIDIGTIEAALKLRDEASATIAKFSKNLNSISGGAREVGESMTRVGVAITAGVVVPFGAVIKQAKDFESAFANVVKTVEGFDVDAFGNLKGGADEFRDSLLKLSTEIPVVADDLANIAAVGGQFGIAKENLLDFTDTVAKLGVAVDGIEGETAAAGLAQIANVTKEGAGAFKEYADVLVDLGNKGNSTEAEILEFAKRLAGAGTQAGLAGHEVFALGAAMANVGLNAEAGGTAMSRLLSQMSRAGAEGAEASQKFADFAGRIDSTVASGANFAKLFQQDAKKALELFFDGLADAAKKGQNLNVILSELGVNEVRQRDTMLRLAGASGELSKQFNNAATAAKDGTALNEEARKKFATFDNQLQLFLNTVRLVAIEVGTPLLRALNGVLQQVKPVTDGMVALARQFADLSPAAHQATLALGLGAGATGVLLILGGTALKTAADLARLLDVLRAMAGIQAASTAATAASGIANVGAASAASAKSAIVLTDAWKAQVTTTTAVGTTATATAASMAGMIGAIGALTGLSYGLGQGFVRLTTNLEGLQAHFATIGTMLGGGSIAIGQNIMQWNALIDAIRGYGTVVDNMPKVQAPGVGGKRTKDIQLDEQGLLGKLPTLDELDAINNGSAKVTQTIAGLKAAVAALTPELRAQITEWHNYDKSNKEIAVGLHLSEDVVGAFLKTSAAAATNQKALAKETAVTSEAFVQFAKEGVASVEKQLQSLGALDIAAKFDDMEAAANKLTDAMREVQDSIDIRRSTQGLSKEFVALVTSTKAFAREIDGMRREMKDADPEARALTEQLIRLKQTDFGESLEAGVAATDEFKAVLLALNPAMSEMIRLAGDAQVVQDKAKEKTKDWTQSLAGLSSAMANLKDLGGGIGFAASFVAQADVALQSFGKVREGIKEFAKTAGRDLSQAFASMAAGLASGFSALVGATDPSKGLGERLLGGAMQGASLGASVGATIGATIASSAAQGAAYGGAWGAAAGVIVGIMIAVFRGRKARREMEIVGAEWGTSISQGLYKQIEKAQKELFAGDRATAALFNFKGILQEAGGLNDLNFDQFTTRLRDVFVALETGKFTTAQALQVMKDNFSAFAQHVIDSGEFASQKFIEILNLNMASGLNSPEIKAFIQGRSAAIGEGLAAMLGPVVEGAAQVGDRVRKAFAAVDDLNKNGKSGTEDYADAVAELNEALRHQREVAQGAIGDLDNIGFIALSTFTRARASGLSFIEALNAIGPALDALIKAQQDLGVEGTNAALNQLMHYRELAAQFPTLVAAASALGPTLLAIQQSGGLTTEALAAMEDQGMRTFNRLRDAGFTENEALAQMADFLKQVEKAHKLLGTPIDENTQRMIDQARAAGLMGDEAVDATTQQRKGFEMVTRAINALIITLGGVPIAIDDISKAIEDGLPDHITIPIDFEMPDLPNDFPGRPGQPGGPPRPEEDPNAPDYQGAAASPFGSGLWDPESIGAATAAATVNAMPEVIIEVPVDLDGETLTRVVARRLPEYTELYGGPSSRTTV